MKNVNQDVFASFADAQMSKEEMKMVKGGAEDVEKSRCKVIKVIRLDDGGYANVAEEVSGKFVIHYTTFHPEILGGMIDC